MNIKISKRRVYGSCGKRKIESSELPEELEDDIQEIGQEFTSENTSVNSDKLPALFNMVSLQPGTVNIDYGGGKYDNVAEYLTQFDVINLVYDPFNRTPEHNREVIRTVKKHGGADTATCSNVLNVIKEREVRINALKNMKKLVKPSGTVYITVYEGSGEGNEGPTKRGYQLNRKTSTYMEEVREVFPDAVRKGKLIIAHPNGPVKSASVMSANWATMPEWSMDPPEYDRPELSEYETSITVPLNFDVYVDELGDFSFVDDCPWAQGSGVGGSWEDENDVVLASPEDVEDAVNDLLLDIVPEIPNTYFNVQGSATLVYAVSGVETYSIADRYDGVYEETSTDNVEVFYLDNKSHIDLV